ncbi:hypothetical protein GR254_18780, partial [Mycobacterium tuberculosis]|nr:hypothetical protein [Mycobacterium tuberculosis]
MHSATGVPSRRTYSAEMVNLMRVKLEYELGYKYSHRIPMQMHNKVT